MPFAQSELKHKDDIFLNPSSIQPFSVYISQKDSTPSSSSGSKISPSVLFIIVILAVIFFISGILHLLVKFFMKHRPCFSSSQSNTTAQEITDSGSVQRQLQQLFHLHDSGLDQAFIDALPVFSYKDVMGSEELFDCAVCLCEFSDQDNLRLLPLCSHAFHIDCIDTWLLSNSTCPLCRGVLFTPDFCVDNPVFCFDDPIDEDGIDVCSGSNKPAEDDPNNNTNTTTRSIMSEKRVFSVRLGKFRSTANNVGGGQEKDIGETSNSNLDARRCFSMGSFQYVVGDSELQVTLRPGGGSCRRGGGSGKRRGGGQNGNMTNEGDSEGKRINMRSKGESFSVSKIWLWSKKDKFPTSANNTNISASVHVNLPWTDTLHAT